MSNKERLRRIVLWIALGLGVLGCIIVTPQLAMLAWNGLVALIGAIIEQGPAAIIAAIISGYVTWTCIIPAGLLIAIIAFLSWIYSN